jgi:RNA polymerase sigma-70 factor (ECF subfamily)
MVAISDDRAHWLARNIISCEPVLRGRIARWRLPESLDIDDVVQEAYARLASLDRVDHIISPAAYFVQIARTIVLMHVRRQRIVPISAIDDVRSIDIASDDPDPEEQTADRQQLHLLGAIVAELPEPSRTAFTMRFIDELSHRQIGERLGMADNAVQKCLARSIKLLMTRLGRGGKGADQASSWRGDTGWRKKDEKGVEQRD